MTRPGIRVHWVKLVIGFAALVALSFGAAALLNLGKSKLNIDFLEFALIAYLVVFAAALMANLTIFAPVPFAVAIMISAATEFNPIIVALCAATGSSLGELSGYYAGRLGKKLAVPDNFFGYQRVEGLIKKWGFWAIIMIAFQPIIPFDVGGLIAGAAKMPLRKFLPALWIGKFPKYILFIYAGLGLIQFLPEWLTG